MKWMEKKKAFSIATADAEKDIDLINQYALKELKPEDVYCFSTVLCDNEVDRDFEKFTDESLETLSTMFVGKTGIKDHSWSMKNQIARLYRVEVETTKEKNSLGEPLKRLRGSAYMLRTDENKDLIASIEGGIVKEISVGFSTRKLTCSICGEPMKRSWWGPTKCSKEHVVGLKYEDGGLCVGLMEEPVDAYEFSFVAVPSQRGAGATKGFENGRELFKSFIDGVNVEELAEEPEAIEKLKTLVFTAEQSAEERKTRAEMAEKAKKILNKE